MPALTEPEIRILSVHAGMGRTLDQALRELPRKVNRETAQRILSKHKIRFRRPRQPVRAGQWVAAACRDAMPDEMDARQSNRERARVRYRVTKMKMSLEDAVSRPTLSPAEKGRLGALKRWGVPEIVAVGPQLEWRWL